MSFSPNHQVLTCKCPLTSAQNSNLCQCANPSSIGVKNISVPQRFLTSAKAQCSERVLMDVLRLSGPWSVSENAAGSWVGLRTYYLKPWFAQCLWSFTITDLNMLLYKVSPPSSLEVFMNAEHLSTLLQLCLLPSFSSPVQRQFVLFSCVSTLKAV